MECQCPTRANDHFYNKRNDHRNYQRICVNALPGLTIISTIVMVYETKTRVKVSMPYPG